MIEREDRPDRALRVPARVMDAPTAVPGVRAPVRENDPSRGYLLLPAPGERMGPDTVRVPGVNGLETMRQVIGEANESLEGPLEYIGLASFTGEQWLQQMEDSRKALEAFIAEMGRTRNSYAARRKLPEWSARFAAGVAEHQRKFQAQSIPWTPFRVQEVRAGELLTARLRGGRVTAEAKKGARRLLSRVDAHVAVSKRLLAKLKYLETLGHVATAVEVGAAVPVVWAAWTAYYEKRITLEQFNRRVTPAAADTAATGAEIAVGALAAEVGALCFASSFVPIAGQIVCGVAVVGAGMYFGAKAKSIAAQFVTRQMMPAP